MINYIPCSCMNKIRNTKFGDYKHFWCWSGLRCVFMIKFMINRPNWIFIVINICVFKGEAFNGIDTDWFGLCYETVWEHLTWILYLIFVELSESNKFRVIDISLGLLTNTILITESRKKMSYTIYDWVCQN